MIPSYCRNDQGFNHMQPERAINGSLELMIARFSGNLFLASTVNLSVLCGMIMVLSLSGKRWRRGWGWSWI